MRAASYAALALVLLHLPGCSTRTELRIESDTLWVASFVQSGNVERGRSSRSFEISPDECVEVVVLGGGWCRVYVIERKRDWLMSDHAWTPHRGGTRGDTLRVCADEVEW